MGSRTRSPWLHLRGDNLRSHAGTRAKDSRVTACFAAGYEQDDFRWGCPFVDFRVRPGPVHVRGCLTAAEVPGRFVDSLEHVLAQALLGPAMRAKHLSVLGTNDED